MSKLSRAKRLIGREIQIPFVRVLVQKPFGSVRVLAVHWVEEGSHLCLDPKGDLVIHSPPEAKAAWEKIKGLSTLERPEMWPGEVFVGSASFSGLYFRVTSDATGRQGLVKVPSRIRQRDLHKGV